MNTQKLEPRIQKAEQVGAALRPVKGKHTDVKTNIVFALVSPACLLLAFMLPADWTAILVFSVWIVGGLCSFGILAVYAYTDKVSHKMKEATLSFLLGNLFVFFVFLLKPT